MIRSFRIISVKTIQRAKRFNTSTSEAIQHLSCPSAFAVRSLVVLSYDALPSVGIGPAPPLSRFAPSSYCHTTPSLRSGSVTHLSGQPPDSHLPPASQESIRSRLRKRPGSLAPRDRSPDQFPDWKRRQWRLP